MSAQGRPLELAVNRAAARYLREGRAWLRKQHVPWVPGVDGILHPTGDAPIDFLGGTGPNEAQYVAGRALAVECKETSRGNLPHGELHASQRSSLQAMHDMGAIVLVVVDFTDKAEVYAVTWPRVAAFYAAPWRKSMSLEWFRANGLVLPEENRDAERGRKTLFLEGREHWAREQAQEAVDAERLAHPEIVSLEPADEVMPAPPMRSEYSGLTKAQIAERIIAASNAGLDRQIRQSGRRGRFKKSRGAR